MYQTRQQGGLGIPCFCKYYYAGQMAQLTKYHASQEGPLWADIDSEDCAPCQFITYCGSPLEIEKTYQAQLHGIH